MCEEGIAEGVEKTIANDQGADQEGEVSVSKAQDEITELRAELAQAKELAEKYLTGWKYAQADLENYKKRVRIEKEEMASLITQELLLRFLPVYDSLERALAMADESIKDTPLFSGIEKVAKQFLDVLEKEGARPVACVGKPFDPAYHEAIMRVEDDGHEENTVIEEVRKGFMIGDKVLRPSLVKVSYRPEYKEPECNGGPCNNEAGN